MVQHPLFMSTLLKLLIEWGFHYLWNFNQVSNALHLDSDFNELLHISFKYSLTWNFLFTQSYLNNKEWNS